MVPVNSDSLETQMELGSTRSKRTIHIPLMLSAVRWVIRTGTVMEYEKEFLKD